MQVTVKLKTTEPITTKYPYLAKMFNGLVVMFIMKQSNASAKGIILNSGSTTFKVGEIVNHLAEINFRPLNPIEEVILRNENNDNGIHLSDCEVKHNSTLDNFEQINYFCAFNLKTEGNPRIDLMLNCADFWFYEQNKTIRVNRRLFTSRLKLSSYCDDDYVYTASDNIPNILGYFIQNLIDAFKFRTNKQIVEYFNEYCAFFANIKLSVNGDNYIRAIRTNNKDEVVI